MSPFKRTERAKAKQRARGAHAKPVPEKLRGGELPVGRVPFVRLLGGPAGFGAGVPVELASQDYEFPHVDVPSSRPIVSAGELLEALDADEQPTAPIPVTVAGSDCGRQHYYRVYCVAPDTSSPDFGTAAEARAYYDAVPEVHEPIWDVVHTDGGSCRRESQRQEILSFDKPTQPIPVTGKVLDDEPQPARHAGLVPAAAPVIPVPSLPFLNAHPPRGRHAGRPEPEPQVAAPLGPDQSARLSGPELAILGRPVPANLPAPVRAPAPRGRVFGEFDGGFWSLLIATQRRAHAVADTLARDNDRTANALDRALEAAQQCVEDGLAQVNAPTSTLPRRTPGAAKAAIDAEAELAELAVAR